MLGLIAHRRPGRHERREEPARQIPAPPPPEWARPLLSWLERRARGEWTDPRHEDMYRALHRRLVLWERQQKIG